MGGLDIIIVIIYLAGLIYMGYKLSGGNETQEDYFIGGRSMSMIPVALSIAATTISANSFIGGPGWSYDLGMKAFMNQFSIPLVMALVSTVFIPFFYNLNITSIYEYLEMRFGGISRLLVVLGYAGTSLILVGGFLYIPSLIIQNFTGLPLYAVIPLVVAIAIIYTLLGGIKAVIWTDAIQMVILWGGMMVVAVLALKDLGVGFFEAMGMAKAQGLLTSLDPTFSLNVDNGLWGMLIGCAFLWLQYFATDQTQTQRMFASKSVNESKKSICISGIVMNITYSVFMLVGIILFVFYKGKNFNNSNDVMITFIYNQVPSGLLGIILAAIFAGAMSSVDSVINAISAVFTKDIYERYFSKGEEASLRASRWFTLVFGILIIIFTLLAFNDTTSSILEVINVYLGYIVGSILGVFLLGMFTKKANDKGTAIGFLIGILVTAYVAGLDTINWSWQYVIGTLTTVVVGYIFSLIIKQKQKPGYEEFTFKIQRAKLIAEADLNDKKDYSNVPGTVDKYTLISLGFFVIQFIILLLIQV